jgi:predicted XRE-type DNA-binding protein
VSDHVHPDKPTPHEAQARHECAAQRLTVVLRLRARLGQCQNGQTMTIDTEIRHVTKAGANLFLELGFSTAEARKLHAASRKQINDTRLLKQQLMAELANWITEHQFRQADAAQILMVSRPRVSDVVNQKTAKFTIDTLVEMLSRVGKPVRLAVD